MTRIAVTGAGGQLGYDIVRVCAAAGDDVVALARSDLDVGDRHQVDDVIADTDPDIVINCAAWTAVDACESDPDRAMRDNGFAVGHLRDAADRMGAHLVQISTDYVFDGTKPTPYVETDQPNPTSVYGSSKLAGERAAGESATTIRTSWVCGEHGNNMVTTVLRLIGAHPVLKFVDDQIGNPSFTADLAAPIRALALDRSAGIFHLTNSTPNDAGVSWYRFVRDIVEAAGGDPSIVHPIPTAQLDPPRPAPRPANSVLANTKTDRPRDYRDPLAELVERLTSPSGRG